MPLRLLALLTTLSACTGATESAAVTCESDDGTFYAAGESYDADCGNTCTCQDDGEIVCTEIGCP